MYMGTGRFIKVTMSRYLIESMNNFDEQDVEQWMSGDCIPFVVALSERFPEYKIAVLNDEYDLDDDDVEYNFNFVHAFCYHPDNDKVIIDAIGVRRLKDLYDDFYDISPVIDWDIPNAEFLISNFAGKDFYSEQSYDYDISEYQQAKQWIEDNINVYKIG